MITKQIISNWIDETMTRSMTYDEVRAEALMLSWHHWHDLSQMTLQQFAMLSEADSPISYGANNCPCCRTWCCDECPLITEDGCGQGRWQMFNLAYEKWASGERSNWVWEPILMTAAADMRNFIGWIIEN